MSGRALALVADDDADMRGLLRMLMEDEGFEVESASDGEQALRMARARRPDVCVFDVVMPRLRGHEVLRALRDDISTRDIPVVLVTATLANRALWRLSPQPDDCMRKTSISELGGRVMALFGEAAPEGA
jgi:CheY-like chemotaxis protein